MTGSEHGIWSVLFELVVIKIIVGDFLRLIIKYLYRLMKRLLIRTEQDTLLYLHWRNQAYRKRLKK